MSKPSITNCPNTFFRKFIVSTVFSVHYLVLLVCKYVIPHYQVVIAVRSHLFPFRTEKLSSLAPMVLQCGRVGSRLLSISEASITKVVGAFLFFLQFCFLIAALSHRLRGSFYLFTYSVLDFINVYRFKIKKRVCHKSMAHPLLCYLLHNPRSIVAYSKKGII